MNDLVGKRVRRNLVKVGISVFLYLSCSFRTQTTSSNTLCLANCNTNNQNRKLVYFFIEILCIVTVFNVKVQTKTHQ